MAEHEDEWVPDFKPAWPDVFPEKLIVLRSMVAPRHAGEDDEGYDGENDEVELSFVIRPSMSESSPKFALLADLTARDTYFFAGVSVLLPLRLRDEPDEMTAEQADDLLARYGEWASCMLYDFAASHLRTSLAGSVFWVDVPFTAPRPDLQPWNHEDDEDTSPL